jgi:hypothetical protein
MPYANWIESGVEGLHPGGQGQSNREDSMSIITILIIIILVLLVLYLARRVF